MTPEGVARVHQHQLSFLFLMATVNIKLSALTQSTADLMGMGMNFMGGDGVKVDGDGVRTGKFCGDGAIPCNS